jgi:hypothetical protein
MDPLLLLAGFAYLVSRKKSQGGTPGHVNGGDAPVAFLYQLPDDGFTTTRMAVSSGGDDPKEMGVFGTPDAAIRVATSNGWTIAHGGQVLALKNKPGA